MPLAPICCAIKPGGYGPSAACTTPPPPPGTPGWAYLAAVLAERNRRSVRRLAQARAVTATVWPELVREVHGGPPAAAPPTGPLRPAVPA